MKREVYMRRLRNAWVLFLVLVLTVALTVVIELFQPEAPPLNWAIRGFALLGYQFLFLAILSSAFLRELVRFFGRPFITLHHIVSITGLALMTLHPLGAAYEQLSLAVFLPRFDTLRLFLVLGGRPAWYLIILAVLAALLRQIIGKGWRWVHGLNYVAFMLITVHANLIGTDFQNLGPRIGSIVMAVVVTGVFVRRRIPRQTQRTAKGESEN
jgi:DMSO/TMAO reductase YedYZ heme-binding membrane subunit